MSDDSKGRDAADLPDAPPETLDAFTAALERLRSGPHAEALGVTPLVAPEPLVEPDAFVETEPLVEPELLAGPEPLVEPELLAGPEPLVEPEPAAAEPTVAEPVAAAPVRSRRPLRGSRTPRHSAAGARKVPTRLAVVAMAAAAVVALGAGVGTVALQGTELATELGVQIEPRTPVVRTVVNASRDAQVSPVEITIPKLKVSSRLDGLRKNRDNTVQVPEDVNRAGWYALGAAPGEPGPAVILGHVDSKEGPAIFFGLDTLVEGDRADVRRADGSVVSFAVVGSQQVKKTDFPTEEVYGQGDGTPTLRLVTCGGRFDASVGHYEDNLVVYLEMVDVDASVQAADAAEVKAQLAADAEALRVQQEAGAAAAAARVEAEAAAAQAALDAAAAEEAEAAEAAAAEEAASSRPAPSAKPSPTRRAPAPSAAAPEPSAAPPSSAPPAEPEPVEPPASEPDPSSPPPSP